MVKKNSGAEGIYEGNVKYGALIDFADISSLTGQLLTYVDATYSDKEQREAHKSLVKKVLRNWYYACENSWSVEGKVTWTQGTAVGEGEYVFSHWKDSSLPKTV